MKKTISLLSAFLIAFSMVSLTVYSYYDEEEYKDPFSTLYAVDYDDIYGNTRVEFKLTSTRVEGLYTGGYIVFKDLNFDRQPKSVDLHLGVSAANAGTLELRLDDPKGPILLKVNVQASDWTAGAVQNELITEKVSGVHDLYVKITSQTCHLYSFTFHTDEVIREVSPYATYRDSIEYDDIKDNEYLKDILTAISLGFMTPYESDSFKPVMPVTRQEFAKTVYEIMSLQPSSKDYYSDIDDTTPNYQMINSLKEAGYMNGKSETSFEPLSFVNALEASVVAVRMLGFEHMAILKGGYPSGYRAVAQELGILSGIDQNDVIRRETLARWIVNVINADYADIASVKNDSVTYSEQPCILEKTKNIYRGTGVVTANPFTALHTPTGAVSRYYAEIDGETFYAENTYANAYLGINCDYYYTEKNGIKELVSIAPSRITDIRDVWGKDFTEISTSGISYYENNDSKKETTLKTNVQTAFIVNGKAINTNISNIVTAKSFKGAVLWIDNDKNGIADTVVVDFPETYKIGSINKSKIIDAESVSKTCSLLNNDYVFIKDSQVVEIEEITAGTIASVYESKNTNGSKFVRVVVMDEPVTGGITMTDKSGIYIDGTLYKSQITCNVNDYGDFYVNEYGYVVYYDKKASSNDRIGLYLGYAQESLAFSDGLQIRVFETSGDITIYKLNDKRVVADGYTITDLSQIVNGNSSYGGIASLSTKTPIKYRLNAANEITLIDTVVKGAGNDNDKMTAITTAQSELYYRPSLKLFTLNGRMRYPIDTTGHIFKYYSYAEDDEANDYTYKKASSLSSNEKFSKTEIYSSVGDADVGNIVIDTNRSQTASLSRMMLVADVSDALDSNGDVTKKLHGYVSGKDESFILNYRAYSDNMAVSGGANLGTLADSLRNGDVIKYILNGKKEIVAIKLIYNRDGKRYNGAGVSAMLYSEGTSRNSYDNNNQSDMTNICMHGKIEEKTGDYIKIRLFDGNCEYVFPGTVKATRYDVLNDTFETGVPVTSLEAGEAILIGYNSSLNSIIVFANSGL